MPLWYYIIIYFFFYFYTSHSCCVMISNRACRNVLKRFVSGSRLSPSEYESLRQMLLGECPSILPFLGWVANAYDDATDYPRSIKVLVKALAASSSVCGFIHPFESLHNLLNEIVGGLIISHHPTKLKQLQDECPLLFDALHDISMPTFPTSWHPMPRELSIKSMQPFSSSNSTLSSSSSYHLPDQGISFFPNLPIVRRRGIFSADNCRQKEDVCNKNHPLHSFSYLAYLLYSVHMVMLRLLCMCLTYYICYRILLYLRLRTVTVTVTAKQDI